MKIQYDGDRALLHRIFFKCCVPLRTFCYLEEPRRFLLSYRVNLGITPKSFFICQCSMLNKAGDFTWFYSRPVLDKNNLYTFSLSFFGPLVEGKQTTSQFLSLQLNKWQPCVWILLSAASTSWHCKCCTYTQPLVSEGCDFSPLCDALEGVVHPQSQCKCFWKLRGIASGQCRGTCVRQCPNTFRKLLCLKLIKYRWIFLNIAFSIPGACCSLFFCIMNSLHGHRGRNTEIKVPD